MLATVLEIQLFTRANPQDFVLPKSSNPVKKQISILWQSRFNKKKQSCVSWHRYNLQNQLLNQWTVNILALGRGTVFLKYNPNQLTNISYFFTGDSWGSFFTGLPFAFLLGIILCIVAVAGIVGFTSGENCSGKFYTDAFLTFQGALRRFSFIDSLPPCWHFEMSILCYSSIHVKCYSNKQGVRIRKSGTTVK